MGFTRRCAAVRVSTRQQRKKEETMSDECDVSEIITTFLLNTCRLRPWIRRNDLWAAKCCALKATKHPENDEETAQIPLTTGSVAEFYIEPMLPLFCDIDVMFYFNTVLAIPLGHPPPTQYQLSFTTMSRYMRLLTVTYLAMCT